MAPRPTLSCLVSIWLSFFLPWVISVTLLICCPPPPRVWDLWDADWAMSLYGLYARIRAGLRLESHSRPMGRSSHHPSTDEETDKAMALRSKGGKGPGGEPGATDKEHETPTSIRKGLPFSPS